MGRDEESGHWSCGHVPRTRRRRRLWRLWLEAWETIEFDEPELIDAGDHVVQWVAHQKMRGRGSGIEIETPPYGFVYTFRDGKVVRVTHYLDKREALEAAGLGE